ncbi:unnamed protein product [Rodentolepis nana]|uniref:DUF4116 domain-containing protein n=1 Tax=Rodentolepis nana TaxID=102285 RepID=A0A0R3TWT7_RODNA|nr:unnamed protein product [Rodentolepis nana]
MRSPPSPSAMPPHPFPSYSTSIPPITISLRYISLLDLWKSRFEPGGSHGGLLYFRIFDIREDVKNVGAFESAMKVSSIAHPTDYPVKSVKCVTGECLQMLATKGMEYADDVLKSRDDLCLLAVRVAQNERLKHWASDRLLLDLLSNSVAANFSNQIDRKEKYLNSRIKSPCHFAKQFVDTRGYFQYNLTLRMTTA